MDATSRHWNVTIQAIAANSALIQFFEQGSAENCAAERSNPAHPEPAQPTPELCALIFQCNKKISEELSELVHDVVGAYNSMVVHFNVRHTNHSSIEQRIQTIITSAIENFQAEKNGQLIDIPVYYSEETGPDLIRIAQANHLSVEDVIVAHSSTEYSAYAVGFAPGFAYLGFVPECIKMPRLESPRKEIPKGSIAIADQQTAVYPTDSPGGWNIIGRTPLDMLVEENDRIKSRIQSGDRVRFTRINREDYLNIGGQL